jgi:hypothetical protein
MRKPIEKMNAGELADEFNPANTESSVRYDYATMYRLTSRLREIHDLTRWIPVSERMPNNEEWVIVYSSFADMALYDGDCGVFLRWGHGVIPNVTHWRRIAPPEGV